MNQLQAIKAEIERLRKIDRVAFEKEHITPDIFHGRNQVENHLLSFIESLEKEPKIKGWVARDKDGSIWFHYQKPHKENDIEKSWWGSDDRTFELFDVDYLDLKWEDEPIEVELPIIRTNNI